MSTLGAPAAAGPQPVRSGFPQLRLFPALGQHGLIQIGACDLISQLRQLQRQIPAADGTIQHRFNARTGKDGLIVLPEDIPPALVEAQVVDISTVI